MGRSGTVTSITKPKDIYPAHPRWGAALSGKPIVVDGVSFYHYRYGIMRFVAADPVSGASVWNVSWKNGNPRGYQGYFFPGENLPIRKTKVEAARDALNAACLHADAAEREAGR